MNNLLKIIRLLGTSLNKELSIRQISKKVNLPYTTVYRIIMRNKKLFSIKKKANIRFCSLNIHDNIIKNYLAIAERENTHQFLKKNPKIKKIFGELPDKENAILLFGSRASEKNRKKSDIDICIINKDGKKDLKFSDKELLYNLEINPIFLSKKEFSGMLGNNSQNLAKEILSNHILFHGEEYFWEVVLNGFRKKVV